MLGLAALVLGLLLLVLAVAFGLYRHSWVSNRAPRGESISAPLYGAGSLAGLATRVDSRLGLTLLPPPAAP